VMSLTANMRHPSGMVAEPNVRHPSG
jgi:hypothetical protein